MVPEATPARGWYDHGELLYELELGVRAITQIDG
jgi:hypothetical protein